jgi:hypothetical protein
MRPVETVVRKAGRRIKEKDGRDEIYHSTFVNVTMNPWYNYNMQISK